MKKQKKHSLWNPFLMWESWTFAVIYSLLFVPLSALSSYVMKGFYSPVIGFVIVSEKVGLCHDWGCLGLIILGIPFIGFLIGWIIGAIRRRRS